MENNNNDSELILLNTYQSYVVNCQLYYLPGLVIFGVLGNILSVFVFFNTKLKKLSSSYYLSSLAISDTVFLIMVFVAWLVLIEINWFLTEWVCKLAMYLIYVSSFVSVWLIMVFTIERFVAVRYPLLRQSLCTISRAKLIVVVLTIVSLLSYSPCLLLTKVMYHEEINKTVCTVDPEWNDANKIFTTIDAVLTIVIPVFTISILNALIGRSIWKLSNIRKKLIERETNNATQRKTNPKGKTKSASVNQNKVTRMLLIISTVFLFISLPSYIMRLLLMFYEPETDENRIIYAIIQHIFQLVYYTNYAMDFALYCISGQNFRKAAKSLLCKNRGGRMDTPATGVTDIRTNSYRYSTSSKKRKTIIQLD